jgi:hypothetical protein
MAFNEFREIVGAREQARVDQEMNQLRTLGSAPMQPTPTAPAAQNLAAPTGGPAAVVQQVLPRLLEPPPSSLTPLHPYATSLTPERR